MSDFVIEHKTDGTPIFVERYEHYLAHHGILGQKWGVRRYQNKDGTLTEEGQLRVQARKNIIRNYKYTDDVNDIVRTLSKKEKLLLGAELNEDWIPEDKAYEILSSKAKTILTKIGDTPVSFLEIWTNGSNVGQIAIATRNDDRYRGKGLAQKNVEKAIKWTETYGNKTIKELEWWAEKTNENSNKLAVKNGFVKVPSEYDDHYNHYIRPNKNYK